MDFGYSVYKGMGPKLSLEEQIARVGATFPETLTINENLYWDIQLGRKALPESAECWLVVPNWQKVPFFEGCFNKAVHSALTVLGAVRLGFKDYDPEEEYEIVGSQFEQIGKEQGDPDMLIFPIQSGLKYGGKSVGNLLAEIGSYGEFPLDPFLGGVFLYLCPERLMRPNDLGMACPYIKKGKGVYSGVYAHWDERWGHLGRSVYYGATLSGPAYAHCGLATGYII